MHSKQKSYNLQLRSRKDGVLEEYDENKQIFINRKYSLGDRNSSIPTDPQVYSKKHHADIIPNEAIHCSDSDCQTDEVSCPTYKTSHANQILNKLPNECKNINADREILKNRCVHEDKRYTSSLYNSSSQPDPKHKYYITELCNQNDVLQEQLAIERNISQNYWNKLQATIRSLQDYRQQNLYGTMYKHEYNNLD